MLRIKPELVQGVRACTCPSELHRYLQGAVELEHATIPTYLYALFSVRPGANEVAASIVRSVVVEEMLHMTIACNVLNAVGGAPAIDTPRFVPPFPGPLPMNVDDGLKVHLRPLSKRQVHDVFMAIEEPEEPLVFPRALAVEATPSFATIGQFYEAIIAKLEELGDGAFIDDPAKQVVPARWFRGELAPVTDVASAVAALRLIIRQGEGTSTSPLDPSGELAHFYRFSEVFEGRRLVPDASVPQGFAYRGTVVPLDPAGVRDMLDDPKADRCAPGTLARFLVDQANVSYTNLLRALHRAFNGAPDTLGRAMGLMYELRLLCNQMVEHTDPTTGQAVSPSFEYTDAVSAAPAS